jgi:enterobactin synthetase component D
MNTGHEECGDDLHRALGLIEHIHLHAILSGHPAWPPSDRVREPTAKRAREFLAGRYCAGRALAAAGFAGKAPLTAGVDRLPDWPMGWRGSISHTADGAMAVVAREQHIELLGVDMERLMSATLASEVESQIAKPGELACLPEGTLAERLTLLFSAKESLYKALYPALHQFFDFSAARLVEWQPGCLCLRLEQDWGPGFPAGTRMMARYAFAVGHVFTTVYV